MRRSSRPRTTVGLSKSLHQQLNKYALAASAAGVSVISMSQPSEAKIVYTSARVHIRAGQPPFPLDLNHDGIVDFYLLHSFSHNDGEHFFAVCQLPKSYRGPFCFNSSRNGNSSNVIRASVGRDFGGALRYGAKIQHGDRFITSGPEPLGEVCCYNSGTSFWRGPWVNGGKGVKNRYLGMKFKIKGRYHFGWARLTVTTTSHDFTATLTGYAYETIPGKAIVAGKTKGPDVITVHPASLGHLAAGASAIPAWRVKQTAATTHEF